MSFGQKLERRREDGNDEQRGNGSFEGTWGLQRIPSYKMVESTDGLAVVITLVRGLRAWVQVS